MGSNRQKMQDEETLTSLNIGVEYTDKGLHVQNKDAKKAKEVPERFQGQLTTLRESFTREALVAQMVSIL